MLQENKTRNNIIVYRKYPVASFMIWLRRLLQTKLLPSRFALSTYHQMPPKFLNVVTADNATIVSDSDVRISFDAKELELFSFLRDVVQAYEESKIGSSLQKHSIAYDEPLIVRIAGGWVRDKLLNIYSDDIDVSWFATLFNVQMFPTPMSL